MMITLLWFRFNDDCFLKLKSAVDLGFKHLIPNMVCNHDFRILHGRQRVHGSEISDLFLR